MPHPGLWDGCPGPRGGDFPELQASPGLQVWNGGVEENSNTRHVRTGEGRGLHRQRPDEQTRTIRPGAMA